MEIRVLYLGCENPKLLLPKIFTDSTQLTGILMQKT